MSERPEYGPRGYLPERAARRGRKIILREPLGRGWIVASVLAAVALAAIGVAYWTLQAGPPRAPFVIAGPLDRYDPRGADTVAVDGHEVLVVRGAGGIRTFAAPDAPAVWCRDSRRIEARDGTVWDLSGRRTGGSGPSLRPLRAEVHDGRLYVDPSTQLTVPAPAATDERPHCAAAAQARTRGA